MMKHNTHEIQEQEREKRNEVLRKAVKNNIPGA
jgi:hypothetical protein